MHGHPGVPAPISESPVFDASFWPEGQVFHESAGKAQISSGARCTALSICNDDGKSTRRFAQGERAHFFFEFELLDDVAAVFGTVQLTVESGFLVHGKNTFQYTAEKPLRATKGRRIRVHQWIELLLRTGHYTWGIGLCGTDPGEYSRYASGESSWAAFSQGRKTLCHVRNAGFLEVTHRPDGWLTHHGLADLPGGARVVESESAAESHQQSEAAAREAKPVQPTVFHVTHWKAGSQWIHEILRQCCSDRIVAPQIDQSQVRYSPIQRGGVYPTVYLSKQEFDNINLPSDCRRFVVIRDLRDTLVSAYFSLKVSHAVIDDAVLQLRNRLDALDMESGFLLVNEEFLPDCARIQLSWIESEEPVLRYEDLLTRDVELLEETLIDRCGLPISREHLRDIIKRNRFESATGGRARGSEDVSAHHRKGVAGDWRNYFSDRIKKAFKARYAGLLVAAGYEQDMNW